MTQSNYRPCLSGRPDSVRVYLPDTLTLDQLPKKWVDYAAWVVGRVYLEQHLNKGTHDRDDFTRLWSVALKQVLPKRDYRRIMEGLIDAGILEEDPSYRTGDASRKGYSRGYRIAPRYRYRPFRAVWLNHPELVRKLARRRQRAEDSKLAPIHRYLREMVGRLEVAPEFPSTSLALTAISDKESWFSVCRQGRVYTALTSVRRVDRRFLGFDGQSLAQVDVVNSQALFIALAAKGADRHPITAELKAYNQWLQARPNSATYKTLPPISSYHTVRPTTATTATATYPSYVGTYSSNRPNDDTDEFFHLCVEGKIYSRLMDLTGLAREAAKQRFFAVMYGKPRNSNTKVGRAFKTAFPTTWAAICRLKGQDHGGLARWMQTVESYTVIWRVGHRVMHELPDAPLLTIHDSLVTTEEYVERFRELMQDEFRQIWGVVPQMTVKLLVADE
jgi:hypothetical protein